MTSFRRAIEPRPAFTNAPRLPAPTRPGIHIAGVVSFSGPVGELSVAKEVFMTHPVPMMKETGVALFPETAGYTPKEVTRKLNNGNAG